MVVPAAGVVLGDDDGCILPARKLLEAVDRIDQEVLLVERVGVACVPVLIGRGLEEANLGQMPGVCGSPEVREVVLVVRLIGLADHGRRTGRQVFRVGGGLVVLERLVVRDVVGNLNVVNVLVG